VSVTVRIPTILRSYSGGTSEVTVAPDPATLAGVLVALDVQAPGIGARLLDDGGQIRRFMNIFVNDENVRFLAGLDTETPADTLVSVIPAVAGG
jgi:sulfur-carrier protein